MIVAQLSDIHADGSVEALARLDRALEWLAPLRPDVVIVSGDLVEDNSTRSYQDVRHCLQAIGAPFFAVPGNADDVLAMRPAFADLYGWAMGDRLNVSGRSGPLRLIGLDVTVPGAGHGDAAPVLNWLEAELAVSEAPVLLFLHQNPFASGGDSLDRNMCRNADRLAAVIRRAGDRVLAVTCGHVHRPVVTQFAGRPATICPSVTQPNWFKLDGKQAQVRNVPGLMIHHYTEGKLVSHMVAVG